MSTTIEIGMEGVLQLTVGDAAQPVPLNVSIDSMEVDLADLMERGLLTMVEDRVTMVLEDVALTLTMDAGVVLRQGGAAIVGGVEEVLG